MRGWWWLWSTCPGLGAVRMAALRALAIEQKVDLDELWNWPASQLQLALGWPNSLMAAIDRHRCRSGPTPDLAVPSDVLLPMDPHWPASLDRLERPPVALHVLGDRGLLPSLARRHAIAVVGTRAASSHGLAMAERLGSCLAEAGWPVLSGLAEGIDAAVHRGCLSTGGAPVAVLGTPLNRTYPSHHVALQHAVGVQGVLLSELRPGQRVLPGHFAARNRLIVAMAAALVVVECPERSGALISARLAHSLQCPVWVIPADASRWSARGSNRLLRNQATALLSPEDLIDQIGAGPWQLDAVGADKSGVLAALGDGANLDELVSTLNRPAASLMPELVSLELSGRVVCESGFRWKPAQR